MADLGVSDRLQTLLLWAWSDVSSELFNFLDFAHTRPSLIKTLEGAIRNRTDAFLSIADCSFGTRMRRLDSTGAYRTVYGVDNEVSPALYPRLVMALMLLRI